VVDDHAGLVDTIVRFFRLSDEYDVASAADGYEAGLMMAKFQPDLVILDIVMPYRTGLDVCQKIKANPETSQVSVLVITGHPEDRNIEKALEYGVDDCLLKPFDMMELKKRVEELLKKKGHATYDRVG